MQICLVVVNHETVTGLNPHEFGARHLRVGSYFFEAGGAEHFFKVVPISGLQFWPKQLADCYVFQSDEKWSPWILNLGRYLPGNHDWTTTTEVLEQEGLDRDGSLETVCKLIAEGKVVPFKPFATTWLFMRRHYTVLFSKQCCDAMGCDKNLRTRLLNTLRKDFDKLHEYSRRHMGETGLPEPMITVEDFITEWRGAPGIGKKFERIISDILDLHGLKAGAVR